VIEQLNLLLLLLRLRGRVFEGDAVGWEGRIYEGDLGGLDDECVLVAQVLEHLVDRIGRLDHGGRWAKDVGVQMGAVLAGEGCI
jgi:hypothetical protein